MFKNLWNAYCKRFMPKQLRTIHYAFPATLIAATLFIGAAVISSNQSYMTIETHPTTVREGELFTIDVFVTAHTAINAVDIVLAYPEDKMEVASVNTGQSVITLWTEEPYAAQGYIYMRGGTFRRGFLGEHLIASVRARATESGTAHISASSLKLIAGDGTGTEVTTRVGDVQSTRVSITNADGTLSGTARIHIVTDIDGDGEVSFADIQQFMHAWRTQETIFDFNGDGKMSFTDFAILLADSFFK